MDVEVSGLHATVYGGWLTQLMFFWMEYNEHLDNAADLHSGKWRPFADIVNVKADILL